MSADEFLETLRDIERFAGRIDNPETAACIRRIVMLIAVLKSEVRK